MILVSKLDCKPAWRVSSIVTHKTAAWQLRLTPQLFGLKEGKITIGHEVKAKCLDCGRTFAVAQGGGFLFQPFAVTIAERRSP